MNEVAQRPSISLNAVKSSQIAEIGYDAATSTLAIRFHPKAGMQTGPVYHYSNFSPEQWAEFSAAESIGSWFGKNIRHKFDFVKVDDGEPISE